MEVYLQFKVSDYGNYYSLDCWWNTEQFLAYQTASNQVTIPLIWGYCFAYMNPNLWDDEAAREMSELLSREIHEWCPRGSLLEIYMMRDYIGRKRYQLNLMYSLSSGVGEFSATVFVQYAYTEVVLTAASPHGL